MKLSEYQGEAALDILADLIEPAGEIMTDKEIGEVFKKNRFKAIGLAIKNHKKAVMQIMATMDGVPVEEYKCNVFTLPVKILELLNDPDIVQLFTYQVRRGMRIPLALPRRIPRNKNNQCIYAVCYGTLSITTA